MIRINLLPQGKKAAQSASSGSGQLWAGIYIVAAVIWMIGLALVYFNYQSKLDEIRASNRRLDGEIAELRQRSEGLEEKQAQLERSRRLEEVVAELNRARTGPLRVVMELSRVLSNPGGPTIDPAELARQRAINPYAGYREGWDVKRLWMASFVEERRECRIQGGARTNEDVAEFLRRLTLSELFTSVVLNRTSEQGRDESATVNFELTCQVTY